MSPTVFRLANITAHIDASDRDQAGQCDLAKRKDASSLGKWAEPRLQSHFCLTSYSSVTLSLPLPPRRTVTRRSLGLANRRQKAA
jgi:hypothetical protein